MEEIIHQHSIVYGTTSRRWVSPFQILHVEEAHAVVLMRRVHLQFQFSFVQIIIAHVTRNKLDVTFKKDSTKGSDAW